MGIKVKETRPKHRIRCPCASDGIKGDCIHRCVLEHKSKDIQRFLAMAQRLNIDINDKIPCEEFDESLLELVLDDWEDGQSERQKVHCLVSLIRAGADVNYHTNGHDHIAFSAVYAEQPNALIVLKHFGVDLVSLRSSNNQTLLHLASTQAVASWLLQNGFEDIINEVDNHGCTALDTALEDEYDTTIISLLIRHGGKCMHHGIMNSN